MNIEKVGTYKKKAVIFFDKTTKSFIVRAFGRVSKLIDNMKKACAWASQAISFHFAKKADIRSEHNKLMQHCAEARRACANALSLRG